MFPGGFTVGKEQANEEILTAPLIKEMGKRAEKQYECDSPAGQFVYFFIHIDSISTRSKKYARERKLIVVKYGRMCYHFA